jgi:hypothetical protein
MDLGRDPKDGYGYIYILSNPSMPRLYKIGLTTNAISHRLRDLSTTGVPKPFVLERLFEIPSASLRAVEQLAHQNLRTREHHHAKEFFECDLNVCIEAVQDTIFKICHEVAEDLVGRAAQRAAQEAARQADDQRRRKAAESELLAANKEIEKRREAYRLEQRKKRESAPWWAFLWIFTLPVGFVLYQLGITYALDKVVSVYMCITLSLATFGMYFYKNRIFSEIEKEIDQRFPLVQDTKTFLKSTVSVVEREKLRIPIIRRTNEPGPPQPNDKSNAPIMRRTNEPGPLQSNDKSNAWQANQRTPAAWVLNGDSGVLKNCLTGKEYAKHEYRWDGEGMIRGFVVNDPAVAFVEQSFVKRL